jgi:hypothetical protein
MRANLSKIFALDALLSGLLALAIALLPALLGFALGGAAAGAELGLIVFTVAFVMLFLAFGVIGIVWSFLPRGIQLGIAALVLIVGIVTLQPELDLIAVGALVFTAMGVSAPRQKALGGS